MKERRASERLSVKSSVKFLCQGQEKQQKGEILDIGNDGLGIVSQKELTPNTTLEMWVKMPDCPNPFRVRGKVIRSAPMKDEKWFAGINFQRFAAAALATA